MKIADQWFRDILGQLYQRRTATRGELIESTGLNPACVSLTVQHLLKCGILQRAGELKSTGGRKREVLKLNSEAGYFVVVDLEGTRVRIAITSFLGDIRCRWEEDIVLHRQLDIRRVGRAVNILLQGLDESERGRVLAIGVSYTGLMDRRGRVTAVNLGWKDYRIRERLEESLDLPIYFANDGYCKILAERWLGVAQGYEDCVYVLDGVGVGVGCCVGGQLLVGNDGLAGELGHVMVDPSATDPCNCGKNGCLEAIASIPNIVRQYLQKSGQPPEDSQRHPVTEVFARAREGDPAATKVVARAGHALGVGLSHLVSILNPRLIVLGGDLIHAFDLFVDPVRKGLGEHCHPMLLQHLEIKTSSLGHDSGLKGAASLAFRNALEDPKLLRRMTSPVVLEATARHAKSG